MAASVAGSGTAPDVLTRRSLRLAQLAAAVACALGLTILAGWWSGRLAISAGFSGLPPAAANTGLVSVLSGVALALRARPSRRGQIVAAACAHATWLIAAVTIVEHALGVETWFDDWLIGGPHAPLAGTHDKPSLETAVSFALLGAALVGIASRRTRVARAAEVLALAGGAIALVSLFGYIYGIPSLYGEEVGMPLMGMAAPTTVAIVSLAVGTVAARPDLGLAAIVTSEEAGGVAARRLLALLLALVPILIALELAARAGWIEPHLANALVAVVALVLGLTFILRTARRLNQSSARLSQALGETMRWKQLFDRAAWGAALRDPDGTIVAANDTFARVHGRALRDIVGRRASELIAEDRRGEVEAKVQSIAPGAQLTVRSEQVRGDGSRFPALIDATAVTDEEGRLQYRAMFVRDVSELEKAEQARARLATLVDSSDDAIIGAMLDTTVFAWNGGAEKLYGYRADEMIGRSILAVVPPERREETRRLLERVRGGERVPPLETSRLRRDGSRFPVSVTISPIVDSSGQVIGFSGITRDMSERVAMEEALRRSEREHRELVENASDGWFVADLSGRCTDVNTAGARLLGHTREEIIGTSIADLLRPDQVERLWALRERLMSGAVEVGEWELRRSDGTFIPVEVSTKILPDGRWQALMRDIRDRKEAESKLAEAHRTEVSLRHELERLLAASGAISDAFVGVPEGSLHLTLETFARQALLLTRAELAAVCVGDDDGRVEAQACVGASEAQTRAIAQWMRARREGATCDGALRGVASFIDVPIGFRGRRVGHLYLANQRGPRRFDESDERIVRTLAARAGAAVEIARLYESEGIARAWLQTIFEEMPEAVVIADEQGRVVQQNRMAARLARYTGRVDAKGNPIVFDLRSPSGRELAPDELPLRRALFQGEITSGQELCVVTPERESIPVLASAKPIATECGGAGAMLVLQDIRVMKELERLREEWASVVAHDLRQPASLITMSAELLRMQQAALPDPQQKALEKIDRAAKRLDRMIGDLLDISRIEARQLSLQRRTADLSGVVERAVEELEAPLSDFDVRVSVEPLALASIDPDRIHQVLVNLLTNAIKYGDRGTEIRVEVHRAGDQIEISITNRGPGIEPSELPRLFSRFVRTRAAHAGAMSGIGLGLSIAKGIVESHGGRIWVESTPGETTTFHFTVPAVTREHAAPPA